MSEQILSFLLSFGIVASLIAWGFLCDAWQRRTELNDSGEDDLQLDGEMRVRARNRTEHFDSHAA